MRQNKGDTGEKAVVGGRSLKKKVLECMQIIWPGRSLQWEQDILFNTKYKNASIRVHHTQGGNYFKRKAAPLPQLSHGTLPTFMTIWPDKAAAVVKPLSRQGRANMHHWACLKWRVSFQSQISAIWQQLNEVTQNCWWLKMHTFFHNWSIEYLKWNY